MNVSVFTSNTACTSVARRLIRDVGRTSSVPLDLIGSMLKPTVQALLNKGKLGRAETEPAIQALHRKLAAADNVIDVKSWRRTPSETARLSTNEVFELRFMFANNASGSESTLSLVACGVTLDRRSLVIRISETGIAITDHVLARWMAREHRKAEAFFQEMLRAMRLAIMLGPHTAFTDHPGLAVVHQDGLLIGTTTAYAEEKVTFMRPVLATHTSKGCTHVRTSMARLLPEHGCIFNFRTHIDGQSLSEPKLALRDAILAFENKHEHALYAAFECFGWGGVNVGKGDHEDRLIAEVMAASEDARILVNSRMWQRWAASCNHPPRESLRRAIMV